MKIFSLFSEESLLSSFLRYSSRKGQRSSENPRESAAHLPRQLPLRKQSTSTWASFQPASSYRPATPFWLATFSPRRHHLWPLRCLRRPMPPPPRRPLCPFLLPGSALLRVRMSAFSRILPLALALACISRIFSRNLGGISGNEFFYEICEI